MKHLADFNGPGGAAAACDFLWRTRLQPLVEEYLRGMGKRERSKTEIEGFRNSFLG